MFAKPQTEHQWLEQLVGEWTSEMECSMGPGQPPMTSKGSESVRSLGGLWTVGEGEGDTPEGEPAKSIMTLGYDPKTGHYVGTFVASCMTHLWVYKGSLDESGKVLKLDAEGPSFTGEGLANYQDCIEFIDADHRTLKSFMQGADGQWNLFMTAHYYRKK